MYLVTGGAGFVGQHLVKRLLALNKKVRVLDTKPQPKWMMINREGNSAEYLCGDITNIEDCLKACEGIDTIFNLASLLVTSGAPQKRFWAVNVSGTKTLLDAAVICKVRKVVQLSSDMVYGTMNFPAKETDMPKPIGPYGKSKLAAEQICRMHMDKILITILRPAPIIGMGRGGLFTILCEWINKDKKVYVIGDGNNYYQYVDIRDVIDACLLSEDKGDGETFNLGADNVPKVGDLLNKVIKYAKTKAVVTPLPSKLAKNTIGLLNAMHFMPLDAEHYTMADCDRANDSSKAKKILGWKPKYQNIDMLRNAYDWYLAHKDKKDPDAKEGFLKILKWFS